MSRLLSLGLPFWVLVLCVRPARGAEEATKIDPKAAAAIRAAGEHLRQLSSFRCEITAKLTVTAGAVNREMGSEYTIALERPNRVALRLVRGELGASVISDGKQTYHYLPVLNRYAVQDAPEALDRLFEGNNAVFVRQGGTVLVPALLAANPTEALLKEFTAGKYVGEEQLDGVKCHRLRLSQALGDWDVWIEAGERPLIRQMASDMSAALAQAPANVKLEASVAFKNWQLNVDVPAEAFRFEPPAEAQRVDSLFDGLADAGRADPHALVGKPAPALEADLLDGGKVKLADLKGKKVAILDFWATWCGPCVQALPLIAQAAKDFEERGVVLYAVNVGEEADDIRKFLKDKNLQIQVVLDPDSKLKEAFGVGGIPQTVLIGKDGTVQVVHVGFSPDLKEQLSKELEALLKGENLAAKTPREKEEAKRAAAAEMEGAALSWSDPGSWTAVAAAGDLAVAIDASGDGVQLDAKGNKQRELKLAGRTSALRIANLLPDKPPELLAFSAWGQSVEAYSLTGEHLWNYGGGQGIDDVWAFDLDGDKLDEVLIGYNGGTGLHALDAKGRLLWKFDQIGNVWHVTAGDVSGDAEPEVVTTSATGQVHLFDRNGKKLKDLDAGIYANMVRVAPAGLGEKSAIIVGGADRQTRGEALVRIDEKGKQHWSLPLAGHIDSAHAAPSRPWIAVGQRGGMVTVVDANTGKAIARIPGQGHIPQVAWFARKGEAPLLLVATGQELNAFSIQEPQ